MKKRRLLAFVLCLVMLFSDATSTLASTMPDTTTVTETSEGTEADTEAEVPDNDETEESVPSEGTTEEAAPAETEEISEEGISTEKETIEEEATELLVEEDIKLEGESSAVTVEYSNGDECVAIGDGYATTTEAKAAITEFLEQEENADFAGEIHIYLNEDISFAVDDFVLEDDGAYLTIHLNGYTLTMPEDDNASIRANIDGGDEMSTIKCENKDLTLLPICNEGEDWFHTNIRNVEIVVSDDGTSGLLTVGESTDANGALVKRYMQLDNVAISGAKDVTFRGSVGYNYDDGDADTADLIVTDELTIENGWDDDAEIYQNADINAYVKSTNVTVNGSVTVTDLYNNLSMDVTAGYNMTVRNSLYVNVININAGANDWDRFTISKAVIIDRDNNNEVLSEAELTLIDGVYMPKDTECPLIIQKKNIYQYSVSDDEGNSWIEEEHDDGRAFNDSEVVMTLSEATSLDVNAVSLEQWENNERMFLSMEDYKLVARKAAVEVSWWDSENECDVKVMNYGSWNDAMNGIKTDFADMEGQYNILLLDNVTLTEDVVFPTYVTRVCMNHVQNWCEGDDENEGHDEAVFVTMDFAGHTMQVTGDIDWSEAILLRNSGSSEGEIYIDAQAIEWTEETEGYEPTFRFNSISEDMVCVDTEGNEVKRTSNYTWDEGVKLHVPEGKVEWNSDATDWTRTIDATVDVRKMNVNAGTWKFTNYVVGAHMDCTFIGENAIVTIENTNVIGGDGFEVRGKLTLEDITIDAHEEDKYATCWVQIVETYDRDNENALLYKGSVEFAGTITDNGVSGAPIRLSKKEVYRYQATDEEGNPLWENEEEQIPWYEEDQYWDVEYASGETLATVSSSSVKASMFTHGSWGYGLELDGKELKVYKASVGVDYYDEETDEGISYIYRSLEEAMESLKEDFNGREGNYTIIFIDDVAMSEDITVPDFVTNLRLQTEWTWYEHYDENDNLIMDEYGNVEGHHDVDFATLDMNGHAIVSNGTIELIEGLQIVSKAEEKGKIISYAVTGGDCDVFAAINIRQLTEENLIDENGDGIDRNQNYEWTFVNNVDIQAPNGIVQLYANWANYKINGTITAQEVNVRGNWYVTDAELSGLYVESGWYDEEIDYGEAEGFITFGNLTVENGWIENNGTLFVEGTLTANGSNVWNQRGGLLKADKIEMPKDKFFNYGEVSVVTFNVRTLVNGSGWDCNIIVEDDPETEEDETVAEDYQWGGLFICDYYTQAENGNCLLEGASNLIIRKKATIYNMFVGGGNGDMQADAGLYAMEGAEIEFKGMIGQNFEWIYLCTGIFDLSSIEGAKNIEMAEIFESDEEGNTWSWYEMAAVDAEGNVVGRFEEGWPMQNLSKNQKLFTTEIEEFPADMIHLNQGDEEARYRSVYQKGNEILVGGNWIEVQTIANGDWEYAATFSVWSDAMEYIEGLANDSICYGIYLYDDIDAEGTLSLPTKADEILILGMTENQAVLTYEGDLSLETNVVIDYVKLNAVDNTGKAYESDVILNGNWLAVVSSDVAFNSITDTQKGGLKVWYGNVTVKNAVKDLEFIEVFYDSKLTVGTEITGITKFNLESATIEAGTDITVENIASYNDRNKIIYGDSFTVTGKVTGPLAEDEEYGGYAGEFGITSDNNIAATEEDVAVATMRGSAIDISKTSLEKNGYKTNDVLVTAPNVAATWFVVGSKYNENGDRTGITSLTHKEGSEILYGGATTKAVELRIYDWEAMGYVSYDSYDTLQEAFDAIEKAANKDGIYYIALSKDVELAAFTTPKNARQIQIWAEGEARKLTYDGDMKLNTHLLMSNIVLAPISATSKINLGDYSVDLIDGTKLADGCKITSVTGSGVKKDSAFDVHNTKFTISGDIKNVGAIWIQSAELTVEGTVNAGDIVGWVDEEIPEASRMQATLIGTAKVTRKDGVVTKVDPQITLSGEMWYDWNEIDIALQEKQADGTYKLLDFTASEMAAVRATGIQLAKAPSISSMLLFASEKNKAGEYITTKDNGYVVAREKYADFGVLLGYVENDVEVWTRCETVADAVTEIDNLGTKRAYKMLLLTQTSTISLNAPTALKMPNAKAIESLKITSNTDVVDLCYTGNIAFTSDVTLENVNLVQVVKSGNAYVSANTQKNGYPAIVSVSTGGYALTIEGKVNFNTPIKLDGKNKGTLNVNGNLVTLTNNLTGHLCGSVTNFAEVNVAKSLIITEYGKASGTNVKYTAPVFSATTVRVANDANLMLIATDAKSKFTVTDLVIDGCSVFVEGAATVKNTEMNGDATFGTYGKMSLTNVTLNDDAMLGGSNDMTISGTLTSNTPNAVLIPAQKSAANLASGLNIKGKVVLTDPENTIGIAVTDYTGINYVTLTGSPNPSGLMLTAKTATADMFKAAVIVDGETTYDSVGGKGAYSSTNTDGYVLVKSGTGIYVYYGSEINVEVSKNGILLGYYSNLDEAVKAIDALKDVEAVYEITLLKDANSASAAAALNLPKAAKEVVIQSSGTAKNIYFKGSITLKAPTTFNNVNLCSDAASYEIKTGSYDLTLLHASDLVIAGNITGKGTLTIGQNTTVNGKVQAKSVVYANSNSALTVGNSFVVDNVTFNGGNVLDARKNTVTIGTIVNNGSSANKIIYGKDAKNISCLTITGWVSGDNENAVLLQLISPDMAKTAYDLQQEKGKMILDSTQKIATIEKAPLSCFEMMINDETFYMPQESAPKFSYQLVKADKGVYHIYSTTEAALNGTWLEMTKDGKSYVSCCLDFAQAVNEINTIADKEADYIIHIGRMNTDISDTNLTDNKVTSPITMPKANVANSVTIAYSGNYGTDGRLAMEFTGNISYAGNLGFKNCIIEAANISNVKTLTLDNTVFVTTGTVKVTDVVVKGNTTWDAFGKTAIENIDATEKGTDSYLASKQDAKGVPTFIITGNAEGQSAWKVIKAAATKDTATGSRYVDTYKDVSLVVAVKAGADRFIAYPFADKYTDNNEAISEIIAYKDAKNAVKNGDAEEMNVRLEYSGGTTYAKSFEEAVKLIDNIGDSTGRYTIQLLAGGTKEKPAEVTTKDGAYGAFTFPKKAAWVTIAGMTDEDGNPTTVLSYTGKMQPNCTVEFLDILLSEGSAKGNVFTPNGAITPNLGSKTMTLIFGNNVATVGKDGGSSKALNMTSVTASKGVIRLYTDTYVSGKVNVLALQLLDGVRLDTSSDVTITTLSISEKSDLSVAGNLTIGGVYVVDRDEQVLNASIGADGAITLNDIYNRGSGDGVEISTMFTRDGNSQLTINGSITDTPVFIDAAIYKPGVGYEAMLASDVEALFITDENATPAANQKLATVPKADTDNITVLVYDEDSAAYVPYKDVTLVKHDDGLYMTSLPAVVQAIGYEDGEEIYNGYFLNWEQAVKSIDKDGNKNAYYRLDLLRNVGQDVEGNITPIKNLTLPTKGKQVIVWGDYCNHIFFTETTITAKTNIVFAGVGLMAVEQVTEGSDTWYESTTYDVNIGNNYAVMDNILLWTDTWDETGNQTGYYENMPGTISGSKKGHLEIHHDDNSDSNSVAATKISGVGTVEFRGTYVGDEVIWEDGIYDTGIQVPEGITGVENLVLHPFVYLMAEEGDISVKNMENRGACVHAKNITVTGTAELEMASVMAGTDKVGDGALKLGNIILHDASNELSAKQDANGQSLMQINGTISASEEFEGETEEALYVIIRYNDDSSFAKLYDGMLMLTAAKADVSWLKPLYSFTMDKPLYDEEGNIMRDEDGSIMYEQEVDEEGNPIFDEEGNPIYVQEWRIFMGWQKDDFGLYKSGNAIYYGELAE